MGQVLMLLNQLRLINRSLGVVVIALYLALGFFVVSELMPGSAVAILLNGSGAPLTVERLIQLDRRSGSANPPHATRSKDVLGQRRVPMARSPIASKGGAGGGLAPLRESPCRLSRRFHSSGGEVCRRRVELTVPM
jgi:hypothetical protein